MQTVATAEPAIDVRGLRKSFAGRVVVEDFAIRVERGQIFGFFSMVTTLGISTGRALFDAALAGSAQALAQPSAGILAGARADIVTLDTAHPSLAGRHQDAVLDGWIFAANTGAVDCVWSGGNKVVEGGRHRLRQKARDAFNSTVRRLVA